jgi:hypothetical protein
MIKVDTAEKAKKYSLVVWRFLAAHPEVSCKVYGTTEEIIEIVRSCLAGCPLCEYCVSITQNPCEVCPLTKVGKHCGSKGSPWDKWIYFDSTAQQRKEAADEIVAIVEQWDTGKN